MKKRAEQGIANFRCRKCEATIDFNTFTALKGFCNPCYQELTYGENPLKYIIQESARGETF